MPDPTSHAVAISAALGVKLASVIAGFAGGVVSLSFAKELTKWQAFLAVITGALSAGYITPAIVQYIGGTLPEASLAFIVGLTAMNIIPGFIKLSERWKTSPESFMRGDDK